MTDSRKTAEAMIEDALAARWPHDCDSPDCGTCITRPLRRKTQLGFTDALGYIHTVEIDVDREPGNEDEP